MRYQLTALFLAAALLAPPLLESAPAPRHISPEVYALLYVGKGKNDRENTRRIAIAARMIEDLARTMVHDPEVMGLPVAKEKTVEELSAWMKKTIRVGTLEGTSVLRVWLAEGTPQEQAVVINATVRAYLRWDKDYRQKNIDLLNAEIIAFRRAGADYELGTRIQEREEQLKTAPRLLEWAAVKGKP